MKGIFVDPNETLDIEIYIQHVNNNTYCDTDKTILMEISESEKNIEKHIIKFKKPSFKDIVDISKEINVSATGVSINLTEARYKRTVKLLKEWDFKNEDGSDIPVNEKNVNNLHPSIASVLINQLDLALGLDMV